MQGMLKYNVTVLQYVSNERNLLPRDFAHL